MSEINLIIIPEVNTESGLKLCSGNRKIYIQSLRLFVSKIPEILEKMRALVQQNDVTENSLKNYSTTVHSLKGMCDYIGAEDTRKTAKQLEDIAEAGDIKGILELNENFIKQTEKIITNIQTWLDNNSDYIDTIFNTEQNNG